MKLIVAYIQPERLNAVKQALYAADRLREAIKGKNGASIVIACDDLEENLREVEG